jgi:hypothetical protein
MVPPAARQPQRRERYSLAMSKQQAECTRCGQVKPGPIPPVYQGGGTDPFVCSDCLAGQPTVASRTVFGRATNGPFKKGEAGPDRADPGL